MLSGGNPARESLLGGNLLPQLTDVFGAADRFQASESFADVGNGNGGGLTFVKRRGQMR
jgi:hypothetical protein